MQQARPADPCKRTGPDQGPCTASGGEQLPPFKLGATEIGLYGDNVDVGPGGQAPQEPNVDWETWYKNWIKLVNNKVFKPLEAKFAGDANSYEAVLKYTVNANGTIDINGGSTKDKKSGPWGMEARRLLINLNYHVGRDGKLTPPVRLADGSITSTQIPPFPQGTTRTFVSRSFTFSKNMSTPGITLGGPPQENAGWR